MMKYLIFWSYGFWLAAAIFSAGCTAPAILGGPTGPKWCPNGTVYGPRKDQCCPDGFGIDDYGKCQATPTPPEKSWTPEGP
jgi:hypothetical protein